MKNLHPFQSGEFKVPLDHFNDDGKYISIHYERFKKSDSIKEPLIFLHGGPGNAISLEKTIFETDFGEVLLEHFDILYFHQRGAGKSISQFEKDRIIIKNYVNCFATEQHVQDIELLRSSFFGETSLIQ